VTHGCAGWAGLGDKAHREWIHPTPYICTPPSTPFRLFDGVGPEPQGSPYQAAKFGGPEGARAAADRHLADVCAVMKKLDADITVLSEVWVTRRGVVCVVVGGERAEGFTGTCDGHVAPSAINRPTNATDQPTPPTDQVEDCGRVKALAACLNGAAPSSAAATAASLAAGPSNAYLVQGTDSATGQDVALISKIDPSESLGRAEGTAAIPVEGNSCGLAASGSGSFGRSRSGGGSFGRAGSSGSLSGSDATAPQATTGVSKNLYALFNLGPALPRVAVVGAHLIAYPKQPDRCVQREGQAEVLRRLVADLIGQVGQVVLQPRICWDRPRVVAA
jgi:hypothetical protein